MSLIALEDIVTPSCASSGTPSARKSYFSPSRASRARSPAARWPNRKFSPITTRRACSRSASTARTNSSGAQPGELNGEIQHADRVRARFPEKLGAAPQAA